MRAPRQRAPAGIPLDPSRFPSRQAAKARPAPSPNLVKPLPRLASLTFLGVAVGRANWVACGNEEGGRRAAVMYTLVESCKVARVEPFAYLTDLFERLPAAPASRIADFTPRNWTAARSR